jgi:hypothetical protein
VKIAICTPHYADVAAVYAKCLSRMMLETGRTEISFNGSSAFPQLEVFMRRSSVLPRCRNALVKDAVEWGADYLLWVDADHSFPKRSLLHLLSLNLPVVGVNYPRRAHPTSPTAVSLEGELIWTTPDLAARGELQEVRHLGLGFCLIDMNVVHTLRSRGEPLFVLEMLGDGLSVVAEDVFFFRRIREAGFAVFVDHGLSWHIGHQFDRLLMNADALP